MKKYLYVVLIGWAVSLSFAEEYVLLLHGLCRTTKSMEKMEEVLTTNGYKVINIEYPSRTDSIHELAEDYITPAVQHSITSSADKIHFVTHSLGGIMLRDYLTHHTITNLGYVVMLGPPNQGSEVIDNLRNNFLFQWLNGPVGQELGTDSNSLPNRLGAVKFPLGIIAGDRSINWINSLMISGPDDGKVSIERTKVDGMQDHITLHASHPFLMKDDEVIEQVLTYLKEGEFQKEPK